MEIEGNLTGPAADVFDEQWHSVLLQQCHLNFPGAMFQWQGGSLPGIGLIPAYQKKPLQQRRTLNVSGPVCDRRSIPTTEP